jgi:hypothetical protein
MDTKRTEAGSARTTGRENGLRRAVSIRIASETRAFLP